MTNRHVNARLLEASHMQSQERKGEVKGVRNRKWINKGIASCLKP